MTRKLLNGVKEHIISKEVDYMENDISVEEKLIAMGYELRHGLKEFLDEYGDHPHPKGLNEYLLGCKFVAIVEDVEKPHDFYFKDNPGTTRKNVPYNTVEIIIDYDDPEKVRFRKFLAGKLDDNYLVSIDCSGETACQVINIMYHEECVD